MGADRSKMDDDVGKKQTKARNFYYDYDEKKSPKQEEGELKRTPQQKEEDNYDYADGVKDLVEKREDERKTKQEEETKKEKEADKKEAMGRAALDAHSDYEG